jgi:hypothetical protein
MQPASLFSGCGWSPSRSVWPSREIRAVSLCRDFRNERNAVVLKHLHNL